MAEPTNLLKETAPDSGASPRRPLRVWMGVGVLLTCAVGAFLFVRSDPWGERPGRAPGFSLNLERQWSVEPELLRYRMQMQFASALSEPRAIAVGPNDRVHVAGDQAIHIHDKDGTVESVIALERGPTCLAVGGADHVEPGRLYVGTAGGVYVFDESQAAVGSWPLPNAETVLTSIAVARDDVFLADAGNRVVWRYGIDGEQLGSIGQSTGLVIQSAHFDTVVGAEDLLYVVNPGKLQVMAFTFAGDRGAAWGRASSSIHGFFGCCNPTHLALLPDGRLVTSEQGIPRVKIYDAVSGELEAVVASPAQLDISPQAAGDPRLQKLAFDIAVDSGGHVLVLDPHTRTVRIFVEKDVVDDLEAGS